mmetsp:Transcript_12387/g.46215  ORF Transcript_12387/g.46215 Transcript_12387/m.46215 type:complete len:240 (+) Transcript_12387:62-781(+)
MGLPRRGVPHLYLNDIAIPVLLRLSRLFRLALAVEPRRFDVVKDACLAFRRAHHAAVPGFAGEELSPALPRKEPAAAGALPHVLSFLNKPASGTQLALSLDQNPFTELVRRYDERRQTDPQPEPQLPLLHPRAFQRVPHGPRGEGFHHRVRGDETGVHRFLGQRHPQAGRTAAGGLPEANAASTMVPTGVHRRSRKRRQRGPGRAGRGRPHHDGAEPTQNRRHGRRETHFLVAGARVER